MIIIKFKLCYECAGKTKEEHQTRMANKIMTAALDNCDKCNTKVSSQAHLYQSEAILFNAEIIINDKIVPLINKSHKGNVHPLRKITKHQIGKPLFSLDELKSIFNAKWFSKFVDLFFDDDTNIVAIKGNDDWQGKWNLIYEKNGTYFQIEIDYGSCTSCDPYEELSEGGLKEALKKEIIEIGPLEQAQKYIKSTNYEKILNIDLNDNNYYMLSNVPWIVFP